MRSSSLLSLSLLTFLATACGGDKKDKGLENRYNDLQKQNTILEQEVLKGKTASADSPGLIEIKTAQQDRDIARTQAAEAQKKYDEVKAELASVRVTTGNPTFNRAKIIELTAKLADSEKNLSDSRNTAKALQDKTEKLIADGQQQADKIKKLSANIEAVNKTLKDKNDVIALNDTLISSLNAKIVALTPGVNDDEVRKQIALLEAQTASLKGEVKSLKDSAANNETLISSLNAKIVALTPGANTDEFRKQIALFEAQTASLKDEVKSLKDLAANNETLISSLNAKIVALTPGANAVEVRKQIALLEAQTASLKDEVKSLKDSAANANRVLEANIKEKGELEKALVDAKAREKEANENLSKSLTEKADLAEKLKVASAPVQELNTKLASLTATLEAAQDKLKSAESKFTESLKSYTGIWINETPIAAITTKTCYPFLHVLPTGKYYQAIGCADGSVQTIAHEISSFSGEVMEPINNSNFAGSFGFAILGSKPENVCGEGILSAGDKVLFDIENKASNDDSIPVEARAAAVESANGFQVYDNGDYLFSNKDLPYESLMKIAETENDSQARAAASVVGSHIGKSVVGCFDKNGKFTVSR